MPMTCNVEMDALPSAHAMESALEEGSNGPAAGGQAATDGNGGAVTTQTAAFATAAPLSGDDTALVGVAETGAEPALQQLHSLQQARDAGESVVAPIQVFDAGGDLGSAARNARVSVVAEWLAGGRSELIALHLYIDEDDACGAPGSGGAVPSDVFQVVQFGLQEPWDQVRVCACACVCEYVGGWVSRRVGAGVTDFSHLSGDRTRLISHLS